jgi:hypothetical protein
MVSARQSENGTCGVIAFNGEFHRRKLGAGRSFGNEIHARDVRSERRRDPPPHDVGYAAEDPSANIQVPEKPQDSIFNQHAVCPPVFSWDLDAWCFSGAWKLELGVSFRNRGHT